MQWMEGGGVRGDGFSVRSGLNFAIYQEGSLTVHITIKRGFQGRQHLVTIPSDAFSRWDGAKEEISPEEQHRMRENFVAAMNFSGHQVE